MDHMVHSSPSPPSSSQHLQEGSSTGNRIIVLQQIAVLQVKMPLRCRVAGKAI